VILEEVDEETNNLFTLGQEMNQEDQPENVIGNESSSSIAIKMSPHDDFVVSERTQTCFDAHA